MSALVQPRLHYLTVKGVVELARQLLHVANVPFEDIRYSITRNPETGAYDWDERFTAAKKNGFFAGNLDRVPALEINGIVIPQSKAIERYVSNRYGLYGSSVEDQALIDGVVENIRDIKEKWGKVRYLPDGPEKDAALAKWYNEELKEWLGKLEKSLPANGSSVFVVGTSATYADVALWNLVRDYFPNKEAARNAEQGLTRLSAIADRVAEIEGLKRYLATRPADTL